MSGTELLAFLTPVAVIVSFCLNWWDSRKKAGALAEKTEAVAAAVASEVKSAAEIAEVKLDGIHVLVNSRLTEALERIKALEDKLGLAPGEKV